LRLAGVTTGRGIAALLIALASLAWTAPAGAVSESAARNFADSTGRLQDQLANPEYWPLRQSQEDPENADPYRAPERWAPGRGRVMAVQYPNRYGATISAHLWAPRRADKGPYPAVVFVNGAGEAEEHYWSFAQDLAEHGYVVMTFDPQGVGRSESEPSPEFCDPNGAWREPQEMGVRETGPCAGQNDNGVDSTAGQGPAVADIVVGGHTGRQGTTDVQSLYDKLSPNYIFGAIDAYTWMASPANRWRDRIDFSRVGVMGHSLGAYAAAMVANGDPLRRFKAGIALDSFAHLMHDVQPRVPTLYEQSEQEMLSGPRVDTPPPTALHATRKDYAAFAERGIDTMFVVLRASNHSEFAYTGPERGAPASRAGQRVATYFALAWLDRRLKTRTRRVATARLRARRFDRSVDRSSIGLGTWDPATTTNRPHLIAGQRVADALSHNYVSRYALGRRACDDMRRGCQGPPRRPHP
jgi:pimeloyl-ACP methyl ester carboxylesterase